MSTTTTGSYASSVNSLSSNNPPKATLPTRYRRRWQQQQQEIDHVKSISSGSRSSAAAVSRPISRSTALGSNPPDNDSAYSSDSESRRSIENVNSLATSELTSSTPPRSVTFQLDSTIPPNKTSIYERRHSLQRSRRSGRSFYPPTGSFAESNNQDIPRQQSCGNISAGFDPVFLQTFLDYNKTFLRENSRHMSIQSQRYVEIGNELFQARSQLAETISVAAAAKTENEKLRQEIGELQSLMRTLLDESERQRSFKTRDPATVDTGVNETEEQQRKPTSEIYLGEKATTPSISSFDKLDNIDTNSEKMPYRNVDPAIRLAKLRYLSHRFHQRYSARKRNFCDSARNRSPVKFVRNCRKASGKGWKSVQESAKERGRRGASKIAGKLTARVLPFADFA